MYLCSDFLKEGKVFICNEVDFLSQFIRKWLFYALEEDQV